MQYVGNKGNYFRDTPVTVLKCVQVLIVSTTHETQNYTQDTKLVKMSQIKHMSM